MPKGTVHLLTSSSSLEALQLSHLASARLRLGVAAANLKDVGYKVCVGEQIPPNCDCILVGKIGADDLMTRAPHWLDQIDRAKASGARVVLDYTDHHLGFPSAMGSSFYKPVLGKVDSCVTSSLHLRETLSRNFFGEIRVIPDPIEVPLIPPKAVESTNNILWFGHPSNVPYLHRWIDGLAQHSSFKLITLTNSIGFQLMQRHTFTTRASISMSAFEWSIENMVTAARVADFCVIPSDVHDPRKSGASSNRLLTALALGLPTAASTIPSYREFSEYFFDLDATSLPIEPSKLLDLAQSVARAQREVLPKYSMQALGLQWVELLGNRH